MSEKAEGKTAAPIGVTLEESGAAEGIEFEDCYTVTKRLRAGSYGTVFVTRHLGSDQDLAVKIIDRTYVLYHCVDNTLEETYSF